MSKATSLSEFLFRRGAIACGMLLMFLAVKVGAETEWTQFRGPGREDIAKETGLLKQWPAEGPALAWKMTGVGGGFSGVSIAKGCIYTMGDKDGASQVMAINEADKKILWMSKVGEAGGGQGHPGPRCTPTLDGDMLYVLNQFGDLACFQIADGKEVWRKNMNKDFGGKMMSGWGYSESPLVDGANLVCTPGGQNGSVVALNKKTGQLVWRSKDVTDAASYSSLMPVEFGGVRQYVQLSDKSVYAVAAADGKLLWRAPRMGKTAVVTTPIFKDGIVFVTSGYNIGHSAFKVTASGGSVKAEDLYSGKEMTNHHGGVVLVGEYLYGFSDNGGKLKCMELKTGKVMWENPCVGKGSLTCADGRLYVRSEGGAGAVALVEASSAGYKETGRFNQPDRSQKNSWPHPVICDGKLYLRDQDTLLCYKVK
ncbi:MAG: PQQ-like beta-propeller repeat protein [Candidatus Sumerlaeota bacterium]|nr:PQQ-like beta-propeller repeat protein [Candidatus Sumerlaeota bacterium]